MGVTAGQVLLRWRRGRQPAKPTATARTAVVVHPYSTGQYYYRMFAARGWRVVAVLDPDPPPVFSSAVAGLDPGNYAGCYLCSGNDLDRVVAALEQHAPDAVVAGTETGVVWADALAAQLGLPGNDPATSNVRRSKYLQVEALRAAGLRHARTVLAGTVGEAVDAAAAIRYPVVVKPVDGAAGVDTAFCDNAAQVAAAFHAGTGHLNILGTRNDRMLIQERLLGPQYTVNTVSYPGPGRQPVTYVTDAWLARRRGIPGGKMIFEGLWLLDSTDPAVQRAAEYIKQVLAAVGMRYGAAHTEVIDTAEGMTLVEVNARPAGCVDPEAAGYALLESPLGLAAHAATDPEGFHRLHHRRRYQMIADAVQLDLAASRPGRVSGDALGQLHALPSVRGIVGHLTPGDPVVRTVDLATSPGSIWLVSKDREQIAADIKQIRRIEAEELYAA
jgi:biotin carboxylase